MNNNTITFYWSENCSTCQKAKKFVERHGIKDFELRDIKENPLSPVEIARLVQMLGGADELFSRRAVKYREMKLNERELSETEMIDLMNEDYTFLKRPILVVGDKAIAGFFERFFQDFIYQNYLQK